VTGVTGLREVRPGDDIAALVAAAVPDLRDGDVLVVTSKLLSKAEGRLVPVPPGADREQVRLRAVADETVRVVARRGATALRVPVRRRGRRRRHRRQQGDRHDAGAGRRRDLPRPDRHDRSSPPGEQRRKTGLRRPHRAGPAGRPVKRPWMSGASKRRRAELPGIVMRTPSSQAAPEDHCSLPMTRCQAP